MPSYVGESLEVTPLYAKIISVMLWSVDTVSQNMAAHLPVISHHSLEHAFMF